MFGSMFVSMFASIFFRIPVMKLCRCTLRFIDVAAATVRKAGSEGEEN